MTLTVDQGVQHSHLTLMFRNDTHHLPLVALTWPSLHCSLPLHHHLSPQELTSPQPHSNWPHFLPPLISTRLHEAHFIALKRWWGPTHQWHLHKAISYCMHTTQFVRPHHSRSIVNRKVVCLLRLDQIIAFFVDRFRAQDGLHEAMSRIEHGGRHLVIT